MLDVGCWSKPDANAPTSKIQHPTSEIQHPTSDLSDLFGDGTPEFLRLDSEVDRRAFRHWFTFLAESQYYRQTKRLPREINHCADLFLFAFREVLRAPDGAWPSDPC